MSNKPTVQTEPTVTTVARTLRTSEMQDAHGAEFEIVAALPKNVVRFQMTALRNPEPIRHPKKDRPVITSEMMSQMDCPFPSESGLLA